MWLTHLKQALAKAKTSIAKSCKAHQHLARIAHQPLLPLIVAPIKRL